MLKGVLIGNLGGDAIAQSANGNEFITFRVAHNNRWTDNAGQLHEDTNWVDCTMNERPAVFEFLKAGKTVYVEGRLSTRIYSSKKDRCMKAGVKISVTHIELIGSAGDDVPRRLYDDNGVMHDITKFYHTDCSGILSAMNGRKYAADDNGWVLPLEQVPDEAERVDTK